MIAPEDYINLDRTFVTLPKEGKDQAIQSYESEFLSTRWYSIGWQKLYEKNGPVVILGEPGSGRSYEFKAQKDQLVESGQTAFYLELHRLAGERIEPILEGSEDSEIYANWSKSEEQAYFFLDAVDEAKLDKTLDFKTALLNFRRSLGSRLSGAKVFISSRISAWHPELDKRLVEENLTPEPRSVSAEVGKITRFGKSSDQGPNTLKAAQEPIAAEVYMICPLSRDAVVVLCTSRQLQNPDSFLRELDQSHAWEFARRPLSLLFLMRSWEESGEIGDLTVLLESTVRELLKERPVKDDHARKYPISTEEARIGAEYMAAASVFSRTLDFAVDDMPRRGRRTLSPQDCLPQDWQPSMRKALIDRPLFDSAIYGTFRFHHRRLAEYLAACWLRRRMENQCPASVLFELLFSRNGSQEILKPSMKSVATWLSCLSSDGWALELRQRLLRSNPEVFLRYGDPAKWPSSFKCAVLEAFAARFRDRDFMNLDTDRYALSRLVDECNSASLARMVSDSSIGAGPRLELLKCATESRCSACVPSAFEILAQRQDRRLLESKAIELIGEVGSPEDLLRLKNHALRNAEFAQTHLGWLVRFLFPQVLSVAELKAWLEGTPDAGRLSTERYFVKSVFEKVPEGWCPIEVLGMLCELNEASLSCRSTGRDPNYPGAWTKELIFPVLKHALGGRDLIEGEARVVGTSCAIISLPSTCREDLSLDGEGIDLNDWTKAHPQVRRIAFWLAVEADRREDRNPRPEFSGSWALSHTLKFELCQFDRGWLFDDLLTREASFDKEIAACLLVELWRMNRCRWGDGRRLLQSIKASGLDSPRFRKQMLRIGLHWPPDWFWRLKRKGFFTKWYWLQKSGYIKRYFRKCRNLWMLHSRIKKLRTADQCGWLVSLCRETSDNMRWAVKDWEKLRVKYGRRITKATQDGCVAVWERFTPEPYYLEATPNGIIAGLSGLQFLYQEKELDLGGLSSDNARRAALYAVNEMNGHADWMTELSQSHSEEVRSVLIECIEQEWSRPEGTNTWCRHLELLTDQETEYGHLVCRDVLDLFMNRAPGNSQALTAAFKLLMVQGEYPVISFADRASAALNGMDPDDVLFRPWLAILVQLDAQAAMDLIETILSNDGVSPPDPRSNLMVRLCVMLQGRRDSFPLVKEPNYLHLDNIGRFIRLVYEYVNPRDDIRRPTGEAYSPEGRDDAQSFRGYLLTMLAESTDPRAEEVLVSLADDPDFQEDRDWLKDLAEKSSGKAADVEALQPADLQAFVEKNEFPPKSSRSLFDLTMRRLNAIKHDVEEADHSLRQSVRDGDIEVDFRRFVAREMNLRKNGLYSCTEESVIRAEERLDIRIENPACNGHVVIEAKIANLGRSLNSLVEDLETQLCGRYLNDENARFGVFLVACTANRSWQSPDGGAALNFDEVIERLSLRAQEIYTDSPGVEGLEVIGVDFRQG
ncbi:hypothetical protein DDZ13_05460 [Coraliomargarita sinensis]|uniref:Uncharacterized protein n=1 Tax=Coraliomargarita sinensis TaxID=2174842 RepID=A0A317ZMJ7_9BACT|nr:hypothetical protein [Coraliomargarita sinensis]PXA04621.1 hypothetical protein DDZ13_05460 [Coraliomargarita sinensis]